MARTFLRTLAVSICLASAAHGQTNAARKALNGEWTGTLVLDNSSPRLSFVFEADDSSLTGKVYSDGNSFGPMEGLSLRGDTVHFTVDRLDFTGRVTGTTMTVDLIVYNGSHRNLTLRKTPELRSPGRPSTGAVDTPVTYTEVPGGNHAERWWGERLADGIVALAESWAGQRPDR